MKITPQLRHTNKLTILANDEILVKVRSSNLNKGYSYAGTVEAVGSHVTNIATGTDVFGQLQQKPSQFEGASSDYVAVKRGEYAVKPSGITDETAVASIEESIPAVKAMRDSGVLGQSASVLVVVSDRASLGVATVQIAKALGAHVTAACCRNDMFEVKGWGADFVLDRSTHPDLVGRLLKRDQKFDVIFDSPNILPSRATKLLKPKGTIVNTSPTSAFMLNKMKTSFGSKKVCLVECRSNEADLNLIAKWLKEGDLKIQTDAAHTEELSIPF